MHSKLSDIIDLTPLPSCEEVLTEFRVNTESAWVKRISYAKKLAMHLLQLCKLSKQV